MELQIQDLVTTIRKDGIEAARAEAEYIIADAQRRANVIIAEAEAESKTIKESSEREIKILRENASISAEQAKRDAILAFKGEIMKQFEMILKTYIGKTLSEENLLKLIISAVNGEDLSQYAVELEDVNEAVKAGLAAEMRAGLEIRPNKSVKAGFRLANKDGSGYFDCSDDEILSMLMPYFRKLNF